MRVYFRSRGKVGIHTIRSAVVGSPMIHTDFTALCFTERELLSIEVLQCGNMNFRPFWLLWPWPRPDDLHIWTKPVFPFPHTPGDILDVRKWTSCTKDFASYSIKGGKCVHLGTCGHFRSHNKDGGHTKDGAVVVNPMIHVNLMALSFIFYMQHVHSNLRSGLWLVLD